MQTIHGIPIVGGIIHGKTARKHDPSNQDHYLNTPPNDINLEKQIYLDALKNLKHEFQQLTNSFAAKIIGMPIIELYVALLNDPMFTKRIPELIISQNIHAQQAVILALKDIEVKFSQLDNEYFRARFIDIKSLCNRMIERLNDELSCCLSDPSIIVAHDMSPAELLHLPTENLVGLVLEAGSASSHIALLVESMQIPAIFGVGKITDLVTDDSTLIIDGYQGKAILDPNTDTISHYQLLSTQYINYNQQISQATQNINTTIDGAPISVYSNVGSFEEIEFAKQNHADGVGLLRTEMFYIAQNQHHNEQENTRLYQDIFSIMPDKPITIRTLDLGGDKLLLEQEHIRYEANPYLGYRSTRMFIDHSELLEQQLSSIIKASEYNHNIQIMFPFITTVDDIIKLKEIFFKCWRDIKGANTPITIPIGMMAEIPSAMLCIDDFLPHVDFVSIGTNDLAQYVLAIDRNNPCVARYYQQGHPAVLKLIHHVVQQCTVQNTPVSICGELAREKIFARLLLGMGVTRLSMSPGFIPMIKYILSNSSLNECNTLWHTVSTMSNYEDIEHLLSHDLNNFLRSKNIFFEQFNKEDTKEQR